MSDLLDSEDDRALAAEYALRLLEGEEARAAARRAAIEPAFARTVAYWQERLAALADEVDEVQPSRAARIALMDRVFGKATRQPWWRRAALWQGATAMSLIAAVWLGYLVASHQAIPTLYATELTSDDESLRVLAVYDSVTGHIRITRLDGAAADGRDLQLWAIADGQPPVSVGVLPDASIRAGYEVPEAVQGVLPGLTLAISDEPDGGSPTGQPTGAVLAAAPISEI